MNLRWLVLKVLDNIEFEGLFVHEAIDQQIKDLDLSKQERAFIKKLVFGVIEQRIYLDYVINQSSKVKVKKMKPAIRHIMRLSVYQLLFMDQVPDSAVVNEAVKLVKKRKMHALTGFANGVLRAIIRTKDAIKMPDETKDPITFLSVTYSYPLDVVEYLLKTMTMDEVKSFLAVSNEPAPMTIRHNPLRGTKEELIQSLKEDDILVKEAKWLDEAMYIEGINRVNELKAFKEGLMTIQDESSMLVAHTAYEEGIKKVIDVCSAPGGKATHIATLMSGKGQVLAYDVSDYKTNLIKENVSRMKLNNVRMLVGDATESNSDLVESADVVIADVPCSGLGIIRKKPDIKWHLNLKKIADLVNIQQAILKNVKSYVKPGGVLVYSTCTITKEENENNVEWFLENNPDYVVEAIEGPYAKDGKVSLLPVSASHDGFFITKFRKLG